jgi:hypothetical protein
MLLSGAGSARINKRLAGHGDSLAGGGTRSHDAHALSG